MQKEIRLEFNQDIKTLYKSYTNAKFIASKMEKLGARNIEVEVEADDKKAQVKIVREMAVDLPDTFKKYANTWNKTTQTEYWKAHKNGTYSAEMTLDIENVPAIIKGVMRLEKRGSGSAVEITTTVNSSIPFFGRMVSKFIVEMAEKTIENEFNYISENA